MNPIADGPVHLAARRTAAHRQPLRLVRHVDVPAQPSCPRCTAPTWASSCSPAQGTLWTWTVQGFRPKSPPYEGRRSSSPTRVGYVELPGEVKVETLLVDVDPAELRIGMPMELAIVPFRPADGDRCRHVRLPACHRRGARLMATSPSSASASTRSAATPISGREQGVHAARARARRRRHRLVRRGVRVRRLVGRRRRRHPGQRARADRPAVHQRRQRLRDRRQRARSARTTPSAPAPPTSVMAIGFDKHPRGAFDPMPGRLRPRRLVRRDRPDADDAVLRHEDPALHARARDHRGRAGQGRRQGVPQRVA